MRIKASKLRADIYNILDTVVNTGQTVEVERGKSIVKISFEPRLSKLSNLKKHKSTRGKIDKIFNITWEKEWSAK